MFRVACRLGYITDLTSVVALTDYQKTLCRQSSNTLSNRPDTFSTRPTFTNRSDFSTDSAPFADCLKNLCQTFVWRLVKDASVARIGSR